jgi:hypothetical protein
MIAVQACARLYAVCSKRCPARRPADPAGRWSGSDDKKRHSEGIYPTQSPADGCPRAVSIIAHKPRRSALGHYLQRGVEHVLLDFLGRLAGVGVAQNRKHVIATLRPVGDSVMHLGDLSIAVTARH